MLAVLEEEPWKMNEFMDQGALAWLALSEFMCPVLRSAAMVGGVCG